jgi:hypothetical protein
LILSNYYRLEREENERKQRYFILPFLLYLNMLF